MFSNAHTYIATLVILLTLTVFQFNLYRDALLRSVLLAAMFAMLVGIVLGKTRAPWGGAALTLLIIFVRDRDVRPLLLIGGVIGALAGAVFLAIKFDELGSFLERLRNLDTLTDRLALWATALNMIAHNPVFGVGFGADAFELHRPQYITGVGITTHYALELGVPHNEYLHVGALLGLVGLLAFLGIVVGIVRLMFTLHNDARGSPMGRRLALYVGAIVIGLMFNGLLSDTHQQDYFWMLAYFLAGFAAVLHGEAVWREHVAVRGRLVESPA
jgi:O-antigen ligase